MDVNGCDAQGADFLAGFQALDNNTDNSDPDTLVAEHRDPDSSIIPFPRQVMLQGFQALPSYGRAGTMSRKDAAKVARKAKHKKQQDNRFNKLADAWDCLHALRAGDAVARDGRKCSVHPNKWSIEGLLNVGWKSFGKRALASDSRGIGATKHNLDALVTTSRVCDAAQAKAFHETLHGGLDSNQILGLTLHWHHDATPWRVQFGSLQSKLFECARYLVQEGRRWRTVPFSEYKQVCGKALPTAGIVEVFSQNVSVHWLTPGPCQTKVDLELIAHPVVVASTGSSCIHRACDLAFDDLSITGLHEISRKVKLFIFTETPDNVSANVRRKAHMATLLPNNCLYMDMLGCAAHRIHRILQACTVEDTLIGDIHAIALVASVPRYRATMLDRLWAIVNEDLELLYVDDPSWQEHTTAVLQHTLGREFHFTRGSKMPGDVATPAEELGHSVFQRMEQVKLFLNADWREPQLGHVEKGCCGSRAIAVANVTAAIAHSGMLEGLNSEEVSKNRWGSCTKHLSQQCCGHMCHNVLNRVFAATFPRYDFNDDDTPARDDDDYRKLMRAKACRATHAFAEEQDRRRAARVSWVATPIDALWIKLQFMDSHGSVLFDVVHEKLALSSTHKVSLE